MVEVAVVVVQAEQQRADAVAVLVDAVAGDTQSAVRSCLTLTSVRLSGGYGAVEALGDDAVEPGALEAAEPVGGDVAVGACAGVRWTGRLGAAQRARAAGAGARRAARRAATRRRGRAGRRRRTTAGVSAGQPSHPRLGRVDALLQRVEVEAVAVVGGTTISPSTTHRSGSDACSGSSSSGK